MRSPQSGFVQVGQCLRMLPFILPYNALCADVGLGQLSPSPVVGDLPLTIHRDSSRPTDKSGCMFRRSSASGA